MDQDILASFPSREVFYNYLASDELQDFNTYYDESLFGLVLILRDFQTLDYDSKILEFGSGIGLIANYLASLGFNVTSLEPAGQGFGMMSRLKNVVEAYYSASELTANNENVRIEDYSSILKFDYIYALNVLEHVDNELSAIASAKELLSGKGKMRLIAPNYAFPYEPHFNLPILFGKKFTHLIFRNKILKFPIYDSQGTWSSLNWVSSKKIARIAKKLDLKVSFSREGWNKYLNRIVIPGEFSKRKGPLLRALAPKATCIFDLIPIWLIPIIDATLTLE